MVTVIGGAASGGLNFDTELNIGSLAYADSAQGNASFVQLRTEAGGTFHDNFYGSFIFNPAGELTGGTLNRWQETYDGSLVFDIQGASVPVATFLSWVQNNQGALAVRTVLAGNDSIAGTAYADLLRGYDGADTINGGGGGDLIDGGAGTSYLRGDDGNDTVTGDAAFDDINGNAGDDSASGGAGDDWVVGGKDQDRLAGDDGADIVYGNLGNDTCDGGAGADIVRGGQGDDIVTGGAGNDWLSGDKGSDTVTGGAGADIFHSFGDAGLDRVTNFNRAEGDRVQLDPGSTYTVAQSGADTVISITGGAQMVLAGVSMASLTGDWIFVA
ncbi:calcium-binding protein [Phenylobacterium sp.]|uniref:calcium-binding protein n=1 Tax=Phenylobacterium sp. TaxID=1871053 RepID=UPI002F3FC5CC